MQTKKVVSLIASMALVAVLAVAGTLAYLTATTSQVKNTFVAANLATLVLDESKANVDSTDSTKYVLDTATRVQANTYKVTPSVDIPKDPVATVSGLEQDAYLYIEVIDQLPSTLTWSIRSEWTKVDGVTGKNGGEIWVWNSKVTADGKFYVMANDKVTVASTYTEPTGEESLTFYAYLCQASGFSDAKDAFTKAFA